MNRGVRVGALVLVLAGLSVTPEDVTPPRVAAHAHEVRPEEAGSSARILARHLQLKRKLAQLAPKGTYIVVDTRRNRLSVKRGTDAIVTAVASTGSGTILDKPLEPGSQWVFDTPRGHFTIQTKLTNPMWIKPDWAYLEEGLQVPASRADRVEPGILGEYALGFGNGYFIHGTLYPRLLGKNVTHGCIRLGDDDLRAVYRATRVGTPIIIF